LLPNPHKNQPHCSSPKGKCYRCGEPEHYGNSDKCPAKEAECKKCGIVGHYSACCKTKPSRVKRERFVKKKDKGNTQSVKKVYGNKKRDSASDVSNAEEKGEFAFQVSSFHVHKVLSAEDLVEVSMGSVPMKVLIDSGAMVNVTDKKEWDTLKKPKVKCVIIINYYSV
jgi:hypothetical protein